MLQFPLGSNLFPEPNNFRAGGHREAVIPVPIPNTEVKGFIAEGSVGPAHARVGRRRPFFMVRWSHRLMVGRVAGEGGYPQLPNKNMAPRPSNLEIARVYRRRDG